VPENGIVVANFGSHLADGDHHASLSQYSQLVEDFARDATAWRDRGPNNGDFRAVVWLPSPYLPLRSDGFVVAFKDWRSLTRMSAFNEAASRIMRAHGIPVLDNVSPTNAYMALQVDDAHYTQPNIQATQPAVFKTEMCHPKRQAGPGSPRYVWSFAAAQRQVPPAMKMPL